MGYGNKELLKQPLKKVRFISKEIFSEIIPYLKQNRLKTSPV